mmetsp:Transcript_39641/g.126675  ORF Transcript_39641/g.126675 Transcript_39641/m.126675 type:complete len:320 (-) Transcript_39641:247-1206(-)
MLRTGAPPCRDVWAGAGMLGQGEEAVCGDQGDQKCAEVSGSGIYGGTMYMSPSILDNHGVYNPWHLTIERRSLSSGVHYLARRISRRPIDILKQLGQKDTAGKRHCLVYSYFEYQGHVCMVFERLGMSLYEFLRKNHYKPFKMELVRDFARQMLRSVAFLHNLRLVHTDLKPENILLVSNDYTKEPCPPGASAVRVPVSSKIKLIDFGNATFDYQYHCSVVSTRHYRAPEVVLGLGWTYPCDVWSIGCILLELLTGEALFQTHDNLEHLAMMEAVLGAIPASVAKLADEKISSAQYFKCALREKDPPNRLNKMTPPNRL